MRKAGTEMARRASGGRRQTSNVGRQAGCAVLVFFVALWLALAGCRRAAPQTQGQASIKVLAAETFLADMAQNVAGQRLQVGSLMPVGMDPHTYEPTPGDVTRVAQSDVLIINGAGVEEGFIDRLLQQAGNRAMIIEASAGLTSRSAHEDEEEPESGHAHAEGDPHFWLDPNNAIRYVENIRDGLIQADPEGRTEYQANAAAYIQQLRNLDRWVAEQVRQVPEQNRLLVTNHESLGYYADRYGFRIVGTIIPSTSTGASPSAQQVAQLIERIRATGAKAIFLETGSNPQLAQQIAKETGVKVVTELYTHSLSAPEGPAPTYLDMIRYNTQTIVTALR